MSRSKGAPLGSAERPATHYPSLGRRRLPTRGDEAHQHPHWTLGADPDHLDLIERLLDAGAVSPVLTDVQVLSVVLAHES